MLAVSFSGLCAVPVRADVTTIQPLNFGEFIVRNNDVQHTLTVNPNGTYMFSPGFVEIVQPQPGIYDIDGLPLNMAIASVVVTQLQPLTGAGNSFDMNTFQVTYPPSTDGAGVARFTIGATVETTGSGVAYPNLTYTGDLQIQINF